MPPSSPSKQRDGVGNGVAQPTSSSKIRQRSSPQKISTAPASLEMLNSPVLNPDLLEQEGLLDADESGLLSFGAGGGQDNLGFEDSSIGDVAAPTSRPSLPSTSDGKRRPTSSPSKPKPKGRPSWGPVSSPTKGKLRLLDGLEKPSEGSASNDTGNGQVKKERTLGAMSYGGAKGPQKARQSIFAKPAQSITDKASLKSRPSGGEGDDSFYSNRALSTSSTSVKDRVSSIEKRQGSSPLKSTPARRRNSTKIPEANEHLDVQLAEVKRLNQIFESYEQMLMGSAEQLEDFTTRIGETNALLDTYIDLMRQTERTQQLLLDSDWRGVTEDESMHALAMELAAREQRRREQEAEEQARLIAQRAQEAEQARLAAEQAQQAQQQQALREGYAGARGGMRSSSVRGVVGAPMRNASATRGRTTSSTLSNRGRITSTSSSVGRGAAASGASANSRTVSSTSSASTGGLGNRYGSVRSSGYGPR